jgi:hypothetical protein
MVSNLDPYKEKTRFQSLLSNGSPCATTPWAVYWTSLLATTVLAPMTAVRAVSSSGGARASVVGVAHGTVWGVMPVLVMLFGERGALWGLLAVTQVACLVRAVSVAGGTVGLHSLPDFRLVPSTRIIPAAIN